MKEKKVVIESQSLKVQINSFLDYTKDNCHQHLTKHSELEGVDFNIFELIGNMKKEILSQARVEDETREEWHDQKDSRQDSVKEEKMHRLESLIRPLANELEIIDHLYEENKKSKIEVFDEIKKKVGFFYIFKLFKDHET